MRRLNCALSATFLFFITFISISAPVSAQAQSAAFRQAVAGAASTSPTLTEFYAARDFAGFWTGASARGRRNAVLEAFAQADTHGLSRDRFDPARVMAQLQAAQTESEKGAADVALTALYLDYARGIQTGILTPSRVVPLIRREVPLRGDAFYLSGISSNNPAGFLRALPPSSPEYARLLREKLRLEQALGRGGWGASVPEGRLDPGASGAAVVRLRDRLVAMGYLAPSASQSYDGAMQAAVQRAQQAFGLQADGIAGASTIRALNVPLQARLQSVIVAMERERWTNRPRGARHVWVNLTDFSAAIMDDDRATFVSTTVIGARDADRQSPEFSDVMEFMVINPSWYVPRSIVVGEYLPRLQANPNAVGHIDIVDGAGRTVSRSAVNFGAYTASNFPYAMRQPPSQGNALGLVKFMFPNPYNIYLHDTPSKSLFSHPVRAYSHGCIRLGDPFGFAYALLARQTADPEAFFQERLRSGRESRVTLDQPVPVHLVYRTAFTHTTGELNFRPDIYGRDAAIWRALAAQGVQITARAQ